MATTSPEETDPVKLDPNVLESHYSYFFDAPSQLPPESKVVGIKAIGSSKWADTFRINTQSLPSYFLKVSVGYHGHEALKGEFESVSAISKLVPDFVPRPVGWGSLKDSPGKYFYLSEFHNLVQGPPEVKPFVEKLARLHADGSSPNGKFGFHAVTYNGNLPQENSNTDTWEEFFAKGLKHMLDLNKAVAGPSELDELAPAMFEKVIPRLLRPLESNGRVVKPSLVHGDLWFGNTATDLDSGGPIAFDPCCFWAHNEYEIGNWRQSRNKFSKDYFEAYLCIIPPAHPQEDYDDRNALYAIRFNLHAATMFPHQPEYRASVIAEIKRLVAKHPLGLESLKYEPL